MMENPFAGVPAGLGSVLAQRGFTSLMAIQKAVLAPECAGRDLRISSQTGSGKTVALGLVVADDVVEAVTLRNEGPVRARPSILLIAPTRELAVQIADELGWLFKPLGATVVSLTGGTSLGIDFRELKRDPQVLIGTPGRIRDHLERGSLRLDRVRVLALDEADEMLAMGFEEELTEILNETPRERRTHLISATFPKSVQKVAQRHQQDAAIVAGDTPGQSNPDIVFETMVVDGRQRLAALINVLLMDPGAKSLIFVRTRVDAAQLADALIESGFAARPLSGDLSQRERTSTLTAFRRGQVPILVATDVAARGLDVHDINQVIHVDLPDNAEVLTHRSGRTGRAGRKGRSLVFVPPRASWRIDRMLKDAGVDGVPVDIPRRQDVQRRADERFLEGLPQSISQESTPDHRLFSLAAAALADRDPIEVVAGLLGEMDLDGPCAPRDIRPVAAPEAKRHGRSTRPSTRQSRPGDWQRFQVSWGSAHGADPRRLLAIVCRRGEISSKDVGAISIAGRSSMVEIKAKQAAAFKRSASRPDPRDPRIKFREWRDSKHG